MKTFKFSRVLLAIALSILGTPTLFLPESTLAQVNGSSSANPLQDFQTKDSSDPFSDRGGGLNVLDLIHRSQLGNLRSLEDFSAEQHQNLNDAAAEFRAKQRQLLQQQSTPAAQTEGVTPTGDSVTPLPQ